VQKSSKNLKINCNKLNRKYLNEFQNQNQYKKQPNSSYERQDNQTNNSD